MWQSFGHPPFRLRQLPSPMYQGHLALLEGQAIKREEQQEQVEQ